MVADGRTMRSTHTTGANDRSIAIEVLGTAALNHRSSSHTRSPSPAGFTIETLVHHLPAAKRQLVNDRDRNQVAINMNLTG